MLTCTVFCHKFLFRFADIKMYMMDHGYQYMMDHGYQYSDKLFKHCKFQNYFRKIYSHQSLQGMFHLSFLLAQPNVNDFHTFQTLSYNFSRLVSQDFYCPFPLRREFTTDACIFMSLALDCQRSIVLGLTDKQNIKMFVVD